MKKLVLLLLLVPSAVLFAEKQLNPVDFALKVHVISSATQIVLEDKSTFFAQVLQTTVNGQAEELTVYSRNEQGLLALGDYHARVHSKPHSPRAANAYDIYRSYDLLLPDGTTRTYDVTRLGPASTNP